MRRWGAPRSEVTLQACVIHDLCYSTLGVTRAACDRQLRSNVNAIHFLQDGWVAGRMSKHGFHR